MPGTADCGNVAGFNTGFFDNFTHDRNQVRTKLINVTFNKARLRTVRNGFATGMGDLASGGVEQHGLYDCVARINSKKITSHLR
jgi:hypothetical protein